MDPEEIVMTPDGRVLVGTEAERAQGMAELTNGASSYVAGARNLAGGVVITNSPTAADLVALTGLGLVTWWSLGGPTWAGIASVAVDEVAVPIARAQFAPSLFGYRLDWVGLYGTTPLVIHRAVKNEGGGYGMTAAIAVPVLATQYILQGSSWAPLGLSSRSLITIGAIVREWWKSR